MVLETMGKMKVLLKHWMEHNETHMDEYERWARIMEEDGRKDISEAIYEAIGYLKKVQEAFSKARSLLEES